MVEQVATDAAQRAAAGIWARATDLRDSLSVPTDPGAKLEGIRKRLASPGATLHVACRGQEAEGFALLVPRDAELELVYLAVNPAAWGSGTASMLLEYVIAHAEEGGHESVVLWVLADNKRAISTYLRAGWTLAPNTQGEGERRERQMVLSLRSRRSGPGRKRDSRRRER